MRITIIVESDQPDEVTAVEAWFTRWADRLASVSENQGCGCCVDIWDVDAPREAVDELPPHLCSMPPAPAPAAHDSSA